MAEKVIYSIGGGELKNHTTLKLDGFLSSKAHVHAGTNRPYALFIPTASHDFMPYYNTFHKVYTGIFNIKTDVALVVNREFDIEKIKQKFLKADLIYIGGGDTLFMIEEWKRSGLLDLIIDAYNRGVIISGLSAGAICFFEDIYTDSYKTNDGSPYALAKGIGLIKGLVSPHYNNREEDFNKIIIEEEKEAYAIEDDAMLEIIDGNITKAIYGGGKIYHLKGINGKLIKEEINHIEL